MLTTDLFMINLLLNSCCSVRLTIWLAENINLDRLSENMLSFPYFIFFLCLIVHMICIMYCDINLHTHTHTECLAP